MSCLGVLFAIEEDEVIKLKKVKRGKRPDYISEELEELYFGKNSRWQEQLDKSWDAMHRLLTGGELLFGSEAYPLSGVILGGEVLYGDRKNEEDYIITLKTPEQVADIAEALEALTEEDIRQRYFAIDEEKYGFPLSEEDFEYTEEYLLDSIDFWKRAANAGRFVLFTVDQ